MAFIFNGRRRRVEGGHSDPAGIVFNSRFFEYLDTCSWALSEAALGVAPHQLAPTFDIIGIPLVDARAKFLHPVMFGDTIEIRSTIGEFRRSSFTVQHRLLAGDGLAVEGSEVRVWGPADKDEPATLTPRPIPPDVIERFKAP